MQILSVDVGTGTQDIYLFRSGVALENGFKLVMPSPTMMVRKQIQNVTKNQEPLILTGVMMGGGPCHWAAEDHLKAGFPLYATPESAKTFNDDLDWVEHEMGVQIVGEEEAKKISNGTTIEMKDFDFPNISAAFQSFGVDIKPDAVAVAVFDHGAAPPGISDRQFRFDYLQERILTENRLAAFAFQAENIPPIMTRMQSVVDTSASIDSPLILMDTAPAAILGAMLDPVVSDLDHVLITNIGNFHTLAFKIGPSGIEGLFEHHTGLISKSSLESLLLSLGDGSITHQEVFEDHGHGAFIVNPAPFQLDEGDFGVVVTGPRRLMMKDSSLRPYYAVPFGDMMISGCFGLLVAVADLLPNLKEEVLSAINGTDAQTSPWDAEK
jgi:uncharacterized protein (DUF1786 family)